MGQSKTVDDDPLCWLGFTPDAILTSCKTGKGACSFLLSGSVVMVLGANGCYRAYSDVGEAVGAGAATGGEDGGLMPTPTGVRSVGFCGYTKLSGVLHRWLGCWLPTGWLNKIEGVVLAEGVWPLALCSPSSSCTY